MTTYRLDRRYVLQAIGMTLLIAGISLAVSMVVKNDWAALALWAIAAACVVRALVLWFRPPPVARLDDQGITLGGQLTVRPVEIAWLDVVDVSYKDDRLIVDRGGDTVLVFPLTFAGRRSRDLTRDIFDRLNTANGYQRFDPTAD